MVLRIEQLRSDSGTTFMLIGRMTSPEVQQLKAEIADADTPVTLDLQQVHLVDLDAVHFLAEVACSGIELRHVPQYVREWILLERPRIGAA